MIGQNERQRQGATQASCELSGEPKESEVYRSDDREQNRTAVNPLLTLDKQGVVVLFLAGIMKYIERQKSSDISQNMRICLFISDFNIAFAEAYIKICTAQAVKL